MSRREVLEGTVYPILSPILAGIIKLAPVWLLEEAVEVRLRSGKPLMLVAGNQDYFLAVNGQIVLDMKDAYHCSRDDLIKTLQLISRNSIYAFEQELKMGFFTVPGGHRVGLAGQAIVADGDIKALKNITAMNIRLAREIKAAAAGVLPYVVNDANRVFSTLIIGPPCSGKTTLLRDIVRQLSSGIPNLNFKGLQIGLVDERSEIAACRDGIPTADLGPRADVLDGCPKAAGMLMLIRSMSPKVVVTDELGRQEDVAAVRDALHAGVSVIASVHGWNHRDVGERPFIGELIRHKFFDRYIIISDKPRIGTIDMVLSVKTGEVLYVDTNEVRTCG